MVPAARKGDLEADELPLPSDQLSQQAFNEFSANWEREVAQAKADSRDPSLKKVRRVSAVGYGNLTPPTSHCGVPCSRGPGTIVGCLMGSSNMIKF